MAVSVSILSTLGDFLKHICEHHSDRLSFPTPPLTEWLGLTPISQVSECFLHLSRKYGAAEKAEAKVVTDSQFIAQPSSLDSPKECQPCCSAPPSSQTLSTWEAGVAGAVLLDGTESCHCRRPLLRGLGNQQGNPYNEHTTVGGQEESRN